jgi:hypothetical protein
MLIEDFLCHTLCPSSTRVSVESSIGFRTPPLILRFFHANVSTMLSVKAVCCGVAYPLLQGLLLLNKTLEIKQVFGTKKRYHQILSHLVLRLTVVEFSRQSPVWQSLGILPNSAV